MCIKLVRVHSCLTASRAPINHRREWVIRCSMAQTMQSSAESPRLQLVSQTTPSLYLIRSCVVCPDEVIEEISTPCDGCTGRSPLHTPNITNSETRLGYKAHRYPLTEGLQLWDGFARNYYRSLIRFLTNHFYYRALDLGSMDRTTPKFAKKLQQLVVAVMPELVCKHDPAHGFYSASTPDGAPPCGCASINPAEAVRRRNIAFPLIEPFMPLLLKSGAEYNPIFAAWAQAAADLIWSDRKREQPLARVATEAIRTLHADEILERAQELKTYMDHEAHWGCRSSASQLKPWEQRRRLFSHIACEIMAFDTGLAIERARVVVKELLPLVQPAYKLRDCKLNGVEGDVDRELCRRTATILDGLPALVGKNEEELAIGLFELRYEGRMFEHAAEFRSKLFQQVVLDYDYTFTTPYSGSEAHETNTEKFTSEKACPNLHWEDCDEQIDLAALAAKEPILFYDEVILYEDELADNGVSLLTVKVRVMPSCWFLLLRFWLRVDGVLMRLRDTRMYCAFGADIAKPVILRETCWREATFKGLSANGYSSESAAYGDPGLISQRLPIIKHKTQKLKIFE